MRRFLGLHAVGAVLFRKESVLRQAWRRCLLLCLLLPGLLSPARAQLHGAGTVAAWGYNAYGQASVPADLTDVTAVAAGYLHTVALKADGTVVAWGPVGNGQATVPAGLTGVTAIAAGYFHTLALKSDGTVAAWGYNAYGQASAPAGLTDVTAISAGYGHSVALKSDGTVFVWGDDSQGQTDVPAGLTSVTAIAAGYFHTLALKSDGTVVAWGRNYEGQTDVPTGLTGVRAIAGGGNFSMALKSDGTVVAWGDGSYGLTSVPAGLTGVTAIAAGGIDAIALKSDGTIVVWGDNTYGELNLPSGLTSMTAIAGGAFHILAVQADQTRVAVWGDYFGGSYQGEPGLAGLKSLHGVTAISARVENKIARIADGTVFTWGYAPQAPAGLSGVAAVAAGWTHMAALKADGTVAAWGESHTGLAAVPPGLNGVIAIGAGDGFTVALKADGTVVAWGGDPDGNTNVPAGLSGVTAIAVGELQVVARKSDGTAVAWGYDGNGQTDVPAGMTNVTALAADKEATAALYCDQLPTANPDQFHTREDVAVSGNVLTNDTDPEKDALTAVLDSAPAQGTLVFAPDGSFTYTPAPHFYGRVTFTYRDFDGFAYGAETIATITVAHVNHAPIANAGSDQTVAVPHDGSPATDTASVTLDGSASSDPDSDPLTYVWTDQNSQVVATTAIATLDLTPGNDTFTLTVTDPAGLTNSQSVHVTVNPEPDQPPVADGSSSSPVTVPHDGDPATNTVALTLDGSASSDPDGDSLTYQWTQGGTVLGSTATLQVNEPAGDYTFTLTVTDPYGASSSASVPVHVDPEPDSPPALSVPSSVQADAGSPVTFQAFATDPDGDSLTYSLVSPPAWASINPGTGVVTLAPPAGTSGSFTVTVQATDPYGASDQKSLSVSVGPFLFRGASGSIINGFAL
jgi:alpha-tubulin suppressor-like RCC1 family protein